MEGEEEKKRGKKMDYGHQKQARTLDIYTLSLLDDKIYKRRRSHALRVLLLLLLSFLLLVVGVAQTGKVLVRVAFPGGFHVSLVHGGGDGHFAVYFFRGLDGEF
jgi:hypothetical protein